MRRGRRSRPRAETAVALGPSGNDEVMIASVAGDTTAPPKPWSARAPISIARESASAHASEASTNRAVPATNTRRRPSRSADATAEHQEAREGDRVGVDDPLQAGGREMQPVAHRRQRHVHDGDVEDHHELGQADDGQEEVG